MELGGLEAAARTEGFGMMSELLESWESGANRFDRTGEILLVVSDGHQAIAVGGLNIDPYIDEPGVGRIRHVYVASDFRGLGVGADLVTVLLDHARESFDRVRVRTVTDDGSRFYEALGFERTEEEYATHTVTLDG